MVYVISEDCIACGACISECPNGAIRDGETTCVVNPDRCTECVGDHQQPECDIICPIGAPHKDFDTHETREELLEKWKKLHPKRLPQYA